MQLLATTAAGLTFRGFGPTFGSDENLDSAFFLNRDTGWITTFPAGPQPLRGRRQYRRNPIPHAIDRVAGRSWLGDGWSYNSTLEVSYDDGLSWHAPAFTVSPRSDVGLPTIFAPTMVVPVLQCDGAA
ncbi:MAG TPA: hypothetical protein VK816_11110, partial [Jatrophihabitantaceae bacterium]|nr:hypothetical protein [Jatrophihabitantaceae bacterium]